ncbi:MAG: ACT domain-containing protein [Actinomycetia bacterium]|nr:ACT domain-containing protein [Actinomycetes bacterium]
MEKIKQLSVFIENRAGRLSEVCSTLGKNNINIRGFMIADTEGYGIFRVIVTNPEEAKPILKKEGFTVNESNVICLDVPDKPGGLGEVLKIFSDNDLNVEYMYAIAGTKIVFSVEQIDEAVKSLREKGIKVLTSTEVSAL